MSQTSQSLKICPLEQGDLQEISSLSDEIFGPGYLEDLNLLGEWSKVCPGEPHISFSLKTNADKVVGLRLSYPPGQWIHLDAFSKSHPSQWPVPSDLVGYFKMSMVHPDYQGQGWGKQMAQAAIGGLRARGAKGVITHSWNESPGNSSAQYTKAIGFQFVSSIPGFWKDYIYSCDVCNMPSCTCTASELFLEIP